MKRALFFCFASFAAACGTSPAQSGASEDVGSSSEAIIGGQASPSSQDSVVYLIHADGVTPSTACTGTLIAPNLVLTARHCVSESGSGGFICDENGKLTGVDGANDSGGNVGADFRPQDLYVFTGSQRPAQLRASLASAVGKQIFHDDSNVVCGHDVSVILLDRSITSAVVASIRLDSAVHPGETFTAVGWGTTNNEAEPQTRQERTGIRIREVGPFAGNSTDPPVSPNDFLVGEATCEGDSGGPAFSESTGAIIGVVSRGGNGAPDNGNPASQCVGSNASNNYTETAPFKTVIQQAFTASGFQAKSEPPQDSSSKGCAVSSDGERTSGGALGLAALGVGLVAVRRRRKNS